MFKRHVENVPDDQPEKHEDIEGTKDQESNECARRLSKMNDQFEQLGKYITAQYEMLRRIFHHLPTDSLISAGRVCKEWHDASKLELQTRAKPHCFFWSHLEETHVEDQMRKTFKSGFNGVPHLVIIFNEEYIMDLDNNGQDALKFQQHRLIDNAMEHMPPRYTKCVQSVSQRILGYAHNYNLRMYPAPTSDVYIFNFYTYGPIGLEHTFIRPPEQHKSNIGRFSGLMLPKMPGVKIRFLDDNRRDSPGCETNDETIDENEPFKCLILLSVSDNDIEFVERYIEYYAARQEEEFPVVGGIIKYYDCCHRDLLSHQFVVGIGICGDSVRASTLMIPSNCRKKESVLQRMTEFTPPKGEHVIAIHFTCIARMGNYWAHKYKTVDHLCFREIFPNIPYTGCCVNGEFWLDKTASSVKKPKNSILYSYSSVFLFLAFGPES